MQNRQQEITIGRSFFCNCSIILPEGVKLNGKKHENGELPILSFQNSDGISITADNKIADLNIDAPANHKAIYNVIEKQDLGTFTLGFFLSKGRFQLLQEQVLIKPTF